MHQSALAAAKEFFACYSRQSGARILDIGSLDVNGSLRSVAPTNVDYVGADMTSGPGVDVIVEGSARLPFENGSFDVVVSSSCMEHDPFFWLTFLEVLRVLKEGGVFYINAPTNGFYHRYPSDFWRFYPDAGKALEAWARRNGCEVELVESFVLPQWEGELWNDFVAVFHKKTKSGAAVEPHLYQRFPGIANIWLHGEAYPAAEHKLPEDRRKLAEAEYRMKKFAGDTKRSGQPGIGRAVCSLCGGVEFGPGPNGRMADSGMPPCCRKCGSLERQRIVRRVLQGLPIGFLDWRKGLQFSPDNSVDPKWLREYEVSVFGGDNSLDIQSIDRTSGRYDFVTFNHVLEFIPDARRAFDELLRVLSPGGVIQGCFSAPLLRDICEDFAEPFGPHGAWHLFGKDLVSYFDCAAKGILTLVVEESDPCTGIREAVHLFVRQPKDAIRIRGWLSAWSSTAIIRP